MSSRAKERLQMGQGTLFELRAVEARRRSTCAAGAIDGIGFEKRPELCVVALSAGEVFRGRLTEKYWTPKHELYHNCKQLTQE